MKSRQLPPRVYHMAEAANWASIQRDGLLSAECLVARAGVEGAARTRLLREQRTVHTVLPDGRAIRDQRPMPPAALERCLIGLKPGDWYAMINTRVFFWFDAERLNRQRKACGARAQVVLEIDAAKLVSNYADRTTLTPFNTGAAMRRAARRGAASFVPYQSWLAHAWASEAAGLDIKQRADSHAPVELTIEDGVPDIARYVTRVTPLPVDRLFC